MEKRMSDFNVAQRRRRWRYRLAILCAYVSQRARRGHYSQLNAETPVMRLYLGEGELKRDFCLSRQSVGAMIQSLGYSKEHGWGKHIEVAIFLYWLASSTSYRVVSEAFDVPTSTVCDIVHRVANNIMLILKRVVHFPAEDELVGIGEGFARLAGSRAFSHVAGSIDGTHIRIKPPAANKEDYLNRKLFHSIQLQVVCDHRGRFINTFTGLPGAVHDAQVLRRSSLYYQQLYPPPGWILIGDGGYPCLTAPIALMTPYREPVQNAVQARYNRHHSKARCVVERAIGMMKTRWRSIFLKTLEVKPTFVPLVVSSCAFLHNICISNGDMVEPDVEEVLNDKGDDQPDVEEQVLNDNGDDQPEDQRPGENLRNRMAAEVSAPGAAIPALQDHDY